MNKSRLVSFALAGLAAIALAVPAASADQLSDVGYVDQGAIGGLPAFVAANRQLAAFNAQLQNQAAGQMRGAKSDADRQRIQMQFQQAFSDKQRELVGPLFTRAQLAIAQVSSQKSLSIIVDKRIVVYGGQDVTNDVIKLLQSNQAIVPPNGNPPTGQIGFVDQTALDALPKVKQANDDFGKFAADQRKAYQAKFAAAKSDQDKQAVATEYNKTLNDKQESLLKPLVDQTKSVTADVARKKNLLLVIDRADVIFGGTDITKDVQDALGQ